MEKKPQSSEAVASYVVLTLQTRGLASRRRPAYRRKRMAATFTVDHQHRVAASTEVITDREKIRGVNVFLLSRVRLLNR